MSSVLRPSVVVSGTIAGVPAQGGATWAVVQYLLGLRRLGWDVHFVEPVSSCSDRAIDYLRNVATRFGFADSWCVLADDGEVATGAAGWSRLRAASRGADLLFDISGMAMRSLAASAHVEAIPTRVFVDLDPGFVQWWGATDVDIGFDGHTHFASLSDSIGASGSPIPDHGRRWVPFLPPVVLERWPVSVMQTTPELTTVGHWRSYGAVHRDGVRFGVRAHAVRDVADLPLHTNVPIRPAFAIHPEETADLELLERNGWEIRDPSTSTSSPDGYQRFVANSWAELGFAKEGYVRADTGWFSDRSAAYLASGRPVIALETGYSRRLPTGTGLMAFCDVDEGVRAIDAIGADYDAHRQAARAVAEEHLDSDRVLSGLLAELG